MAGPRAFPPDLVSWTVRPSRTFENLHRVGYLDGKLIVIGNRGTVLQSERFAAELGRPNLLPNIGWELPFTAILNRVYKMQSSTNLMDWNDLGTFTNLTEHSVFTDKSAISNPQRFYRLAEP